MKNKMNVIMEGWRKFVNEAEIGGEKPVPLSQIPTSLAKAAASTGQQDNDKQDDIATGKLEPVAVGTLNPMQKEVIPGKALAFALGFLRDGKPPLNEMEAIVAEDKGKLYIMDGHHRWAGRTLIDPNAKVNVTMVRGATASQIVTALNLWSKSQGRSGNPGKGDVTQFASSIPKDLETAIKGGTKALGQWPDLSPEEVKQSLGKIPGANGDAEKGKQIMIQNAKKLPTQKHPDAPDRVNMPVVKDQAEINKVVADLVAGKIDFKQPLSKATQNASNYQSARAAGQTPAQIQKTGILQKESLRKIIRQVIQEQLKKK